MLGKRASTQRTCMDPRHLTLLHISVEASGHSLSLRGIDYDMALSCVLPLASCKRLPTILHHTYIPAKEMSLRTHIHISMWTKIGTYVVASKYVREREREK